MDDRGEAFEFPGRAPGVLFLHGFTGTTWEIRPVADALHRAGFAVRAPLLPGHGSTPADLSRTVWRDWVDATTAAIRETVRAHGQCVIAGMSLGGLLAIDGAVRFQDAGVVGVATLGCAMQFDRMTMRVLRVAALMGDSMPHAFVPKRGGSDVQDAAVKLLNPGYGTQPVRSAREFLVGQRAVRAALPQLRIPLLALHGLLDRTAPMDGSLEVVRLAGSADASLVILPHSGHLIGVDRDRTEVARQLTAFVQRLGTA